MQKLINQMQEFLKIQKNKKRWSNVVKILGCLVVFCTVYALILPAITLENNEICGKEEHLHTEECSSEQLVCELEEHQHDTFCYSNPEEDLEEDEVQPDEDAVIVQEIKSVQTMVKALAVAEEEADRRIAYFSFDNETDGLKGDGAKAAVATGGPLTIEAADVYKGGALRLDGATAVSVTKEDDTSLLTGLTEMTVSFYAKPDVSTHRYWTFYAAPDDRVQTSAVRSYIGIASMASSARAERFLDGKHSDMTYASGADAGWHHIVVTYAETETTVYVDGVPGTTTTGQPLLTDILKENSILLIGKCNYGETGEYYTGLVDEYSIYNYAMTPEEVRSIGFEKKRIAHFSFDDAAEGLRGDGAKATMTGTADIRTGGEAYNGGAIYLNGTGDAPEFLSVTKNDGTRLLTGLTEMTVSFYSRADNSGTPWAFYAAPNSNEQDGADHTYLGIITTPSKITAERYLHNSARADDDNYRPASAVYDYLNDDKWHHIVVVYKNNETTIYVDGKAGKPVASSYSLIDILGSGSVVQIGKANWGENGEYFNGYLDEYSIFNFAMTPEEVLSMEAVAPMDPVKERIAYFDFDDTADGFSGDGAVATMMDGVTPTIHTGTEAYLQGSIYLDGKTAALDVKKENGSSLLTGLSEMTVSFYAKPDESTAESPNKWWAFYAAPNSAALVAGAETCLSVYMDPHFTITNRFYEGANGLAQKNTLDTEWHHIVVVFGVDETTMYVDGVPGDTVSSEHTLRSILGNNSLLWIGKTPWVNDAWPNGEFFKGHLDEYSIYNYAMTPEEVQAMEPEEKRIAYFSFDNDTAGLKGDGATATMVGEADIRTGDEAYKGGAIYLDGTTDAPEFLNVKKEDGSPLLTDVREMTVSFYAKPDDKDASLTNDWAFYASPNDNAQTYQQEKYLGVISTPTRVRAERYNNSGARPAFQEGNITGDGWQHVVVVYTVNETIVYINDVEVARGNSTYSLSQLLKDNSILQIGKGNWGNGEFFKGYLDEYSIYNYAMTPTEVANIERKRLAYFDFDDETFGAVTGTLKDDGEIVNAHATSLAGTPKITNEDSYNGQSLKLDGSSAIKVTDENGQALLAGVSEMTISYYSLVKPPSTGGSFNGVFHASASDKGTAAADSYIGIREYRDNSINDIAVERKPSAVAGFLAAPVGAEPIWRHVVVVFSRNDTRVYVDGKKLADDGTRDTNLADVLGDGGSVYIGRSIRDGAFVHFTGYLDEIGIYNYAMTDTEVAELEDRDYNEVSLNFHNTVNGTMIQTQYRDFMIDGTIMDQNWENDDGEGKRLDIPVPFDLNGKAAITLPDNASLMDGFSLHDEDKEHEVWQKPGRYQWKLVGWYNIATDEYHDVKNGPVTVEVSSENKNVYYADWQAADYNYGGLPEAMDDGEWHHVVVVYGKNALRNNTKDYTKVYVDGKLGNKVESNYALTSILGDNSIFQIGKANWGAGEYFNGLIDEFSVYNYALPPEDVRNLEAGNLTDGRIAYFSFDDTSAGLRGSGATASLLSGGTLAVQADGYKGSALNLNGNTGLEVKKDDGTSLLTGLTQMTVSFYYKAGSGGVPWGYYAAPNSEAQDPNSHTYIGTLVRPAEVVAERYQNNFATQDGSDRPVCATYTMKDLYDLATDTSDFITMKVFDYGELFGVKSAFLKQSGTSSELWRADNALNGYFVLVDDGQYAAGALGNAWDRNGKNKWTGGPIATSGLVVDEQDDMIQNLFNEGEPGVHYIGSGNFLFSYDENLRQYSYDSDAHGASYNQRDERFYVYDVPERHQSSGQGIVTGFFPFNDIHQDLQYNDGSTNYWFGMSTELNFWLPNDVPDNIPEGVQSDANQVKAVIGTDENGKEISQMQDMKFEFSGDDDVWVFIDGQLILDLGGIHSRMDGSINFSTGEVVVEGVVDQERTNLVKQLGVGDHRLAIYYLERGGNESNCQITFNIGPRWDVEPPAVNTVTVRKNWENMDVEDAPEVTVALYEDGVPSSEPTARLNKDNNWQYTWEGLPVEDADGNEIVYEVFEVLDSSMEGDFDISIERTDSFLHPYWVHVDTDDFVKENEDDPDFRIIITNGKNGKTLQTDGDGNPVMDGLDPVYSNNGRLLGHNKEAYSALIINHVVRGETISDDAIWNVKLSRVASHGNNYFYIYYTEGDQDYYLSIRQGRVETVPVPKGTELPDTAQPADDHPLKGVSMFYFNADTHDVDDSEGIYHLAVDSVTGEFVATAAVTGELDDNAQYGHVDISGYKDVSSHVFEYTLTNTYILPDITIIKKDNAGNILPDIGFKLYRFKKEKVAAEDGTVTEVITDEKEYYYYDSDAETVTWGSDSDNAIIMTDTQGRLLFRKMDEGTYYLEEVSAPGYQLLDAPIEFTIEEKKIKTDDENSVAYFDTADASCLAYFDFDDASTGGTSSNAKVEVLNEGKTFADMIRTEEDGADVYRKGSLYLDGTNALKVTDKDGGSILTDQEELTISLYAKPQTSDQNWLFYAAPDENTQEYQKEKYLGILDKSGNIIAERYNNDGSRPANAQKTVETGTWYHLVVVHTKEETIIYVDGEEKARMASEYSLKDILGKDSILYIGKANWVNGEYFKGLIDDFSIYSRAMSAEEVQTMYQGNHQLTITIVNEPLPKLQFKKVSVDKEGVLGDGLAGAEFSLYDESYINEEGKVNAAATPIAKYTSDEDGNLKQEGLDELAMQVQTNTIYYLVETKSPDGYKLLSTSIQIQVNGSGVISIEEPADWADNYISSTTENGVRVYTLNIPNEMGYKLPDSGSTGTLPYTIGGTLLMFMCLLYGYDMRRKRKGGE